MSTSSVRIRGRFSSRDTVSGRSSSGDLILADREGVVLEQSLVSGVLLLLDVDRFFKLSSLETGLEELALLSKFGIHLFPQLACESIIGNSRSLL